jgi:tetratricopeptide (TPR) repeat protein
LPTAFTARAANPLITPVVRRKRLRCRQCAESPRVARTLNNLAIIYYRLRRYADAEPLFQRSSSILEKVSGPSDEFDVAQILCNLADLYRAQSRYTDAEALYKRALVIREAAHGPDHISMPLVAVAPDHVRPSWTRAIKITVICLALWLGPVVALVYAFGWDNVFSNIGLFFSKMAVITFGGAYAVLAYMAQQAVEYYHWLQPGEMLVGPRYGRNDAGAADQRRAIRGIYGGFPPSRDSRSDGRRRQRVPNGVH